MALRTTKFLVFDLLCQLIKWAFDSMIVYFNWVSRLPTEINKVTCHYRYVKSLKALFGKPNQAVHNHTLTAAAVAKSLQLWLCATPQMAAHQALPSLRFSRQEHWNGLPFPSPMHESEKWKWSCSIMSDSLHPMDCSPPGSSAHGIFQARVWSGVPLPSPTPSLLGDKN